MVKTTWQAAFEEEQAGITALRERQDRERADMDKQERERILEPLRAYDEVAKAASVLSQARAADAEREWEDPEAAANVDAVKAKAEQARRLIAVASSRRQEMQTRHGREKPDWTPEKLADAAQEGAVLMDQVDRAMVLAWYAFARLGEMHQRGLLTGATGARYGESPLYNGDLALPAGEPPQAIKTTPWLATEPPDSAGLPRFALAFCPECGCYHQWTTAEKAPAACRKCGVKLAA